jgi:hypothetical protein
MFEEHLLHIKNINILLINSLFIYCRQAWADWMAKAKDGKISLTSKFTNHLFF